MTIHVSESTAITDPRSFSITTGCPERVKVGLLSFTARFTVVSDTLLGETVAVMSNKTLLGSIDEGSIFVRLDLGEQALFEWLTHYC